MDDNLDEPFEEVIDSDLDIANLKLVSIIQNFTDEFFNDEYEVLKFNINFLENNGFAYQTKIDFMKLNRFVGAAYNTIEANDIQVIDSLISKFYKDIVFLNGLYKNFLEKSKDIESIFKHIFLKSLGGFEGLCSLILKENTDSKPKKELFANEEEKKEFEEHVKETFINAFKKEKEDYELNLRSIINTKTYYFDKLLWSEAKKSSAIVEFFKKSKRADGEFAEELSIKIFIKQYMQTIDLSHAKDLKWHQYLQNVIAVMD